MLKRLIFAASLLLATQFAGATNYTRTMSETTVNHGATLNWTPSATIVVPGTTDVAYQIYRGTTPGGEGGSPINGSPVASDCASFGACTYTDTTANVPFQTYYYTVVAVITESSSASAASSEANGEIPDADQLARSEALGRTLSESHAASDVLTRKAGFGRTDTESNPAATDTIGRGAAFNRNNNESKTASDAISRLMKSGRSMAESNSTSDILGRSARYGRNNAENDVTQDSISALIPPHNLGVTLFEINPTSASLAVQAVYHRAVSETNTALDVLSGTRIIGSIASGLIASPH